MSPQTILSTQKPQKFSNACIVEQLRSGSATSVATAIASATERASPVRSPFAKLTGSSSLLLIPQNSAGLATNPYAVPVLTFFAFMFLVFISGFCASGVLWATNLLPSQPIFEDFSYYLLGTNPWSSPLDYGELLGGSIEKSFEVFHPDRPTILQRLLWSSGIDLSPDSWTLKTLTHFSLGFSLYVSSLASLKWPAA